MEDNIKQIIKHYLIEEHKTLVDVINLINRHRTDDNKISKHNLNNKLTRGTIKYTEVVELAHSLGYNIVWQKTSASKVQIDNTIKSNQLNSSSKSYDDSIAESDKYEDNFANPSVKYIESEISKFINIIINIASTVHLPNNNYKDSFNSLIENRDRFSNSFICIFYFQTLYNMLLMTPVGSELTPTLYYLRNVYCHGQTANLIQDSKVFLIDMLHYLNTKYDNYTPGNY